MRWNVLLLVTAVMVAGFVAFTLAESANTDEAGAPDVGRELPPGYLDWRLISVAHEAGNLNDLRARFWATTLRSRPTGKGSFRFRMGQSSPALPGVMCPRFACHEPVKARDFVFTRYAP